jgi:hypothetical protein
MSDGTEIDAGIIWTVTPLSTRVAVEVALVEVGPLRETTMTLRVFRVAQLMSTIT